MYISRNSSLLIISSLIIFTLITSCQSPNNKSDDEVKTKDTKLDTMQNKENQTIQESTPEGHLKMGAFSMSLSVKDLKISKEFYENLGFSSMGGDMSQNYLIMKNGNAIIGLFQGMFEGNILTFNPGWDENAKNIDPFDDVRDIQKHLKNNEVELVSEVDETTTGPSSLMVKDPDGNLILIDQHR